MIDLAKIMLSKMSVKCQVKKRVTSSDIRRNIESRRFTAVLDAMEDRIDPDKIERTRIANAKYCIESEPVLLRDILGPGPVPGQQLEPGQG